MKAKFDLIRKRLAQTFPCAHENADTSLGNGKIWAKCEDCGDTFQQERWDTYRQNAERHQEALDALDALEALPPEVNAWRFRFPDLAYATKLDGIQPKG